jgi:transcriptional regulator with XRE-family HTH domain
MADSIGERIKILRTENGMTLTELGKRVKLSASHLSQIERDKTAPSLSTLMDIARALDIGPRYFFETEVEETHIQRADRGQDRHTIDTPIECRLLTPKVGSSKLEAYRVTLQPHASPEQLDQFSGEELGFVLTGELTIRVGDEQFVLAAGDSIHYDAFQSCYWSNAGDEPCVVLRGRAASLQDH